MSTKPLANSGDGVQAVGAIVAKNHATGRDILNRKTKGVKFNSAIVVFGELAN